MNEQSTRNPIDVLADAFIQQYREGKRPTIEQFAQQHPEFADDIRDLFPMLIRIEQLKNHNAPPGSRPASVRGMDIERLGDFRIVREIARGGMGVVYEAEQESLHRRVALKVIRGNTTDSDNRILRFRREAEAAAKLHHTNIVPIYGVGEQDGYYFYAMQMIDGVGLDSVLDVLRDTPLPQGRTAASTSSIEAAKGAAAMLRNRSDPGMIVLETGSDMALEYRAESVHATPAGGIPAVAGENPPKNSIGSQYWKNIARVGADAAAALMYAHVHGVLHRDVKPANLLLDRSGNVWITDFGLAKHVEGDTLTHTGNLVGTLRYMAPEQFDSTTDHRSDIYSLGLTLYELLTLQPAFGETQQGRLIQQKTQGAVPSPRKKYREIPRDLETIVLKACATDPANRYGSAGELAADLHRFLEERPVVARRVHAAERFWRWCRRNPAIALSSSVACLLLVITAIVAVLGNMATKTALADAKEAREGAVQSQVRAEKNLHLAIEAFESIFDNIATRGIPQSLEMEYDDDAAPKFESVLSDADADLLRQLLTFYEQFAGQNSADLNLQAKTATAHHRIGQIHQRLGHVDDARASFHDALAIYTRQLENDPDQIDKVVAKARLLNDLGMLSSDRLEMPDAIADWHLQAVTFLDNQSAAVAIAQPVRYELARSHDLAGSAFFRIQFSGLASPTSNRSPNLARPRMPPPERDRPPPPRPGAPDGGPSWIPTPEPNGRSPDPKSSADRPHPNFQHPLNIGDRERRGDRNRSRNPQEFSEYHLMQARQIVSQLLEESSDNPQYRLLMAQIERHRLIHLLLSNRIGDATDAFNEARTCLEMLVHDYPQEPQFRLELADTLSLVSTRLVSISDEKAEQYLAEAIRLCQRLAAAFPNQVQYQALLAASYRNLAHVQHTRQKWGDAERNLDLARERIEWLTSHQPAQPFHETALAFVVRDLAELKMTRASAGGPSEPIVEARDTLLATIARLEKNPNDWDLHFRQRIHSSLLDSLAKAYQLLGDEAESQAAAERARSLSTIPFRPPLGRFRPGFGPPHPP